ncbi:cystatin-A5-like isoform X1 [Hemicordylus capensis]|uniref:cystatin-A5-like isoform X1 n=1 Tax=Hemicordylus capensis TaxID=884348 RepID=UPI002302F5B0|nr:cystatin-A5-like isoform X1 [Hemicordylus capensis]
MCAEAWRLIIIHSSWLISSSKTPLAKVKPQLESQDGRASPFILFIAVLYRSQVVSGTNYLIKVRCGYGAKDYAHLLVFEALPVSGGQAVLQGYQLGRTRSDPLTPW